MRRSRSHRRTEMRRSEKQTSVRHSSNGKGVLPSRRSRSRAPSGSRIRRRRFSLRCDRHSKRSYNHQKSFSERYSKPCIDDSLSEAILRLHQDAAEKVRRELHSEIAHERELLKEEFMKSVMDTSSKETSGPPGSTFPLPPCKTKIEITSSDEEFTDEEEQSKETCVPCDVVTSEPLGVGLQGSRLSAESTFADCDIAKSDNIEGKGSSSYESSSSSSDEKEGEKVLSEEPFAKPANGVATGFMDERCDVGTTIHIPSVSAKAKCVATAVKSPPPHCPVPIGKPQIFGEP